MFMVSPKFSAHPGSTCVVQTLLFSALLFGNWIKVRARQESQPEISEETQHNAASALMCSCTSVNSNSLYDRQYHRGASEGELKSF